MIGNDVIDLALAQKKSNWKRKGFLDKLFIPGEQELILSDENPEMMVWNLWSRKEAAYKIFNRETGIRAFMPLKLASSEKGMVSCEGKTYFTRTAFSESHIHTIAVADSFDFDRIRILENDCFITKINGLPFYSNPENRIKTPASVSHHGNFYYAVILESNRFDLCRTG